MRPWRSCGGVRGTVDVYDGLNGSSDGVPVPAHCCIASSAVVMAVGKMKKAEVPVSLRRRVSSVIATINCLTITTTGFWKNSSYSPSLIASVVAVVEVFDGVKLEIPGKPASARSSWLHCCEGVHHEEIGALKAAKDHQDILVELLRSVSPARSMCGRSEDGARVKPAELHHLCPPSSQRFPTAPHVHGNSVRIMRKACRASTRSHEDIREGMMVLWEGRCRQKTLQRHSVTSAAHVPPRPALNLPTTSLDGRSGDTRAMRDD